MTFESVIQQSMTAGPVSEAAIAQIENLFKINFPPEYRQFLLLYGAVLGQGFQIFGIDPNADPEECPQFVSIEANTIQHRMLDPYSISKGLIPISDDGMGIDYLIDANNQSDSFGRLFAFGPGYDYVHIAERFEVFVIWLSQGGEMD